MTTTPQNARAAVRSHLADPEHNPSFIRQLFLGDLDESLIFPFPAMATEERESLRMILESFRAFAHEKIDPSRHDREGRFGDGVREGMAGLGLMGLGIPEQYGGFGASAAVYNRVFAEVAATDSSLGVYFGAHQSIGCKGIVLFGSEQQKQRWLPGCASGETIAAFCLTEPGSGSDAQAMRTRAVPSDDGSHYVMDGTKIWISNAGFASLFTVFAKVPVPMDGRTKDRVTAFIVDAKAPGIRLGQLEPKMGIKASDTRSVTFEGVRVPKENVLGAVGQGFRIALEILNAGRLGLSAASAHGSRRILGEALAHASQREQFGRPIASFEMIQRKFAERAAEVYAAEAAWLVAAAMVDRGGVDFSLETAACKIFGSELVVRSANDAMQIAGGIGYSREYPYERAVRDARINLIFEGTNEILRALIALMGLQQPGEQLKTLGAAFRHPLQSIGVIGTFLAGRARRTVVRPKFTRVHAAFDEEAERVASLVHDFAAAVDVALRRYGREIIERQMIQERLADSAIDLYLSTATLARITFELEQAGGDIDSVRREVECARLFLGAAARRVRRNLRGVRRNADQRVRQIAEAAVAAGELAPPSPIDR